MRTDRTLISFSLDEQRYALDLACVRRVVRAVAITPLPKAPSIVLGIIDLGGVVIPVINVRERFNHPRREAHPSDYLVVSTAGQRTVALLVDATNGVIEGSAENCTPAGKILPRIELFDGAVKLEDGLVLIHDLDRLLALDEAAALDRALCANAGDGPESGAE